MQYEDTLKVLREIQPPEEASAQVRQAFLQTTGKLAEGEFFEFKCEAGAANFRLALPGLLRKGLAYMEQAALQEVQRLVDDDFVFRRFAWHSPYLIGVLETSQENWRDAVVRLRLMELLLEALKGKPEFEDSWRLLLRQRFCFLACLTLLVPERQAATGKKPPENRQVREGWSELLEYEPRLHQKVRHAQKAWARELIENSDETELWLQRLNREMEPEARYLLLGPDETLWTFCRDYPKDWWFSDYVLRKWFLPHYDWITTTSVAHGLATSRVARLAFDKGGWRPWRLVVGSATLFLLAIATYLLFGNNGPIVMFLVLMGVTLMVWSLLGLTGGSATRVALYPLVLRLPAGVLVGMVTLTGLVDRLVDFEFAAFDPAQPERMLVAVALMLVALGGAGAYLLAEARSRLARGDLAVKRAIGLLAYGYAQAIVLATFASALAGPAGLMPTTCAHSLRSIPLFPNICLSVDYIVLVSALSLGIGVLLQILWEDKAITEPL